MKKATEDPVEDAELLALVQKWRQGVGKRRVIGLVAGSVGATAPPPGGVLSSKERNPSEGWAKADDPADIPPAPSEERQAEMLNRCCHLRSNLVTP